MTTRLSPQRHAAILDELRHHGAVTIPSLAERLAVSEMTIRRDLDALDQRGVLQRTHGGAVLRDAASTDPSFTQRNQVHQPAKQAIAAQAAALITAGDRLILDSGSTVAALGAAFPSVEAVTVLTYSVPIINALAPVLGNQLICPGGTYDPAIDAFTGPLTEQVLADVRVDKAFLGATSIHVDDGFSNSHLQNLALQRIILRVAREVYVLADSTKFTRSSFWLVARLQAVTAIITDDGIPPEVVERITHAGTPVIVAAHRNRAR